MLRFFHFTFGLSVAANDQHVCPSANVLKPLGDLGFLEYDEYRTPPEMCYMGGSNDAVDIAGEVLQFFNTEVKLDVFLFRFPSCN